MLRSIGGLQLILLQQQKTPDPPLLTVLVLAIAVFFVVMVVKDIKQKGVVSFGMVGAVVGGVLGFLFRPSVPLVGQLPLDVVLSRGASLNGLDMLLRSTAEESFNYLIIGAILGAIVAVAVAKGMVSQKPLAAVTDAPTPFCTKCGAGLGPDMIFCGSCGARRG